MTAAARCPLGPTLAAEGIERQACWTLALEQAIRDSHLSEHVEAAMPPWWRPGMPVWRSEPEAVSDMADAPCVDDALQGPHQKSVGVPEDGTLWASQRNAPGAVRAALLSGPGFAISLHAILIGVPRNVSAT